MGTACGEWSFVIKEQQFEMRRELTFRISNVRSHYDSGLSHIHTSIILFLCFSLLAVTYTPRVQFCGAVQPWMRPNRRRRRLGRRSEKRLPTLSDLKARRAPKTDPNPLGVKTSGKPTDSPSRFRNLCTVMPIKEIRTNETLLASTASGGLALCLKSKIKKIDNKLKIIVLNKFQRGILISNSPALYSSPILHQTPLGESDTEVVRGVRCLVAIDGKAGR
ncbi:hypothetical protein STAS_12755 [Striga asiatica]|uniref:Uncharacterized protein n=1 Tax=Striga asiatica TaxID=4170 RepID=A0A5A7PUQ5_STRAF|nr:hypothetical protein STAS_12755 [Striga asiatica]